MIMTKQGIQISVSGNNIVCSDGKMFTYSGGMLMGPGGTISYGVSSINEALGIVIGMYGGRAY